ncbi:protein EARLY STARVATION 1, chloroplastic [Lotus japonicus]|uniref:protein EARLY STARVATION 1, chloroplastic n=1 Tax=Lotus japonicus TaxID=34305 RepID=UPI00258A0CDF|nr:protein EARLY STARVATION 1, chloroplastic [Lotus japonicus]
MAASSRGFSTAQFDFKLRARRLNVVAASLLLPSNHVLVESSCSRRKRRKTCFFDVDRARLRCCCSDSVTPIRRASGAGNGGDRSEEWRLDPKKNPHIHRMRVQASPAAMPFASPPSFLKQEKFYPRCTPRNSGPQSRDTPPKRDTGIANEKDWGISLLNENVNESGTNEDGSTWYRENGEELGENGYRCRWTRMGGQSHDGSSEWKETWWEKSDWTGYKELGVEKSGRNSEGDSWWETWQENLQQDEWSNIARIERSAQKQAKSGTENAGWYEKWWEKYDAKGWTEKGAHKYGRLNEQSWWEKWGEHYDGRESVLKWTDKWAETELGTKWGDKWEERFFKGIGSRHGETWHVSPSSERWSRTWGEEHFGNGKVHKYGNSTTGESWDIVVDEETYYEAEPHYGWADVVGDSSQLLSIEPRERPPGVFPNLDFGSPPSPEADNSPDDDFPRHNEDLT